MSVTCVVSKIEGGSLAGTDFYDIFFGNFAEINLCVTLFDVKNSKNEDADKSFLLSN